MPSSDPERDIGLAKGWAGLTQQGRLLISIEEVTQGWSAHDLLAHESAHDVLLKTSQVGWAQIALSNQALPPWPEGVWRDRCARLLAASVRASRYTHEACATFLPSLGRTGADLDRYWALHQPDYLAAARELEWLRARNLTDQAKQACVFALGSLALSVPILDDWEAERLADPVAAERYWADPTRHPDRRFPALAHRLRAVGDANLEAVAAGGHAAAAALLRDARVNGRPLPVALVPDNVANEPWLTWLMRTVHGPFAADRSLSATERGMVQEMLENPVLAMPPLAPTLMSVLVTRTSSTRGEIARQEDPPVSTLLGYKLVQVLYNALDRAVPSLEPVRDRPIMLAPGHAAVWLNSPGRTPRACRLSPEGFRGFLRALPEEATVAVTDGGYFFGVDIGESLLRNRRHVVLVQQRSPIQVANEVLVLGLDASRGTVLVSDLPSDYSGVTYLLMRPEQALSPIVVVPTMQVTAGRVTTYMATGQDRVQIRRVEPKPFLTVMGGQAMLRDIVRVFADFERKPWPPGF
jgi:hypothetical protein